MHPAGPFRPALPQQFMLLAFISLTYSFQPLGNCLGLMQSNGSKYISESLFRSVCGDVDSRRKQAQVFLPAHHQWPDYGSAGTSRCSPPWLLIRSNRKGFLFFSFFLPFIFNKENLIPFVEIGPRFKYCLKSYLCDGRMQ